ncbi:MAG: dihydrofolate reductase, partial [Bacteroidota bacterium]
SGHPVIMGKRTFESLPHRPLPNRRNIVISDVLGERFDGCEMAYSVADALTLCHNREEYFIIGGASVYKQFLPYADCLYLTRVLQSFPGDVFFPEIDFSKWTTRSISETFHDQTVGLSFRYEIYDWKR